MSKSVSTKNPGPRGASAIVPSWLDEPDDEKYDPCLSCGAEEELDANGYCADCNQEAAEDDASDEWWNLEHGN